MKHLLFDLDETLIHYKPGFMYHQIKEDKQLTYLLKKFNYSKYIYTNATYNHANVVLNNLHIDYLFSKIYSRDTIPSMKPDIHSAISVEKNIRLNTNTSTNHEYYFFDDLLENLKTAKERNWITIWISPNFEDKYRYPYLDYAFPTIKIALIHLHKII
tara:strand:+ start:483 stop:956 length:474 start_codon:yes stop_codon:yes gene_type:complete